MSRLLSALVMKLVLCPSVILWSTIAQSIDLKDLKNGFVAYDLEYTTWPGAMARHWSGPGEHREVVQIGAARFEGRDLLQTGTLSVLVKPKKNPMLSEYFVKLTGITQTTVERNGLVFSEALDRLMVFAGKSLPIVSYGWDAEVLRENIGLHKMTTRLPKSRWHDVLPLFRGHVDTDKINSGRLFKQFSLPAPNLASGEHDGLWDALSLGSSLVHLIRSPSTKRRR